MYDSAIDFLQNECNGIIDGGGVVGSKQRDNFGEGCGHQKDDVAEGSSRKGDTRDEGGSTSTQGDGVGLGQNIVGNGEAVSSIIYGCNVGEVNNSQGDDVDINSSSSRECVKVVIDSVSESFSVIGPRGKVRRKGSSVAGGLGKDSKRARSVQPINEPQQKLVFTPDEVSSTACYF